SDDTHTLLVNAADTSTAAQSQSATFSPADQQVTLSATVTSTAGAVNEGTVTFSVFSGSTLIGTPVTSDAVSAGAASAVYTLPGGSSAGTYQIVAASNPGPDSSASTDDTQPLVVDTADTMTAAVNQTATFSTADQQGTLSATVTS